MVRIAECDEDIVGNIENALSLPHLIARILCARGMRSTEVIKSFLSPQLSDLSDPVLLPDMKLGVARTVEVLQGHGKIGLFGDYDADGITSVALLVNFLKQVGAVPDVYLPSRDEGYGLNERAIKMFAEKGTSLLICVDCGSSNRQEVEKARQVGLETIVLDHHEVTEDAARPYALINPKRADSRFPTRELAACGVTFFFLMALRRALSECGLLPETINLKREMDLVAVGTVADMVPLTGDNRILVTFGLEVMRQKPRAWLKSFLKKNVVRRGGVDEYALGFGIAPRINAAGRVSDPETALAFLTTDQEQESEELLSRLNEANRKRQGVEKSILKEAIEQIETEGVAGENSLVLFREGWPIGVLGIVAQRLVESYGKAAVVITRTDKAWRGSARGVEGLDLHQTITSLASLLLNFGGHKHACGITLSGENLLPLRQAFEREVKEGLQGFVRQVYVDAVIEFDDLTQKVVETIDMLAPFGVGNPRPSLLLPPSTISVNGGFAKIIDEKKRTWHGTIPRRTTIPDESLVRFVASPTIREDMGNKFVHLFIKEFVSVD